MKNTTRKRKKAIRGFEAAYGRQELIDQVSRHLVAATAKQLREFKERSLTSFAPLCEELLSDMERRGLVLSRKVV